MTAGLLLSFIVSFAIGWLLVSLLWFNRAGSAGTQHLVRIFLGFGIGQGITSCAAFLYLLAHGRASSAYILIELTLLACLLIVFFIARRHSTARVSVRSPPPDHSHSARQSVLLALAFYTTVTTALALVALRLWQQPHGGYDAWAIWNARARAIFRGGDTWRDDIYNVIVGHVHLDYPLLLPVSVVRSWMYAGHETTLAPALIAWLFTAATVGLLTSAVAALTSRAQGYVAGLVLLGYMFFVLHANSELAEPPVTFFYLAAFVLIAIHNENGTPNRGALVLAGTAAGLAAWTKNEGLLFLVALGSAHFAVVMYGANRRKYPTQLLALAAGLLPIAILLVYFKTQLAPPNVWIADVTAPRLSAQLTDPGRYLAIAREFARRLMLYDGPGINMAYLLALFIVCFGITRRHLASVVQIAIALTVMLCGFFGVYLSTQPNIVAFISGSIDRLLFQLWPAFVFAFFLLAGPVELHRRGDDKSPNDDEGTR